MSVRRIIGIVLIAAGGVLIYLGVTATRSFGDRLSSFFTGHPTETTMWYLIGGVAAAVVGLVLLFVRGRR
jgi:hypothetical protein